MLKKILLATLITTSCSVQVFAHGVWAGMRADKLQIVYGEGPLDNYYNPKWLAATQAFDENLQKTKLETTETDGKIFLSPSDNTQIITIVSENGYWSNTASGAWLNKAKDENPEATKGKEHHKMSVNYISQDIVFKKEKPTKIANPQKLGLKMEIVPAVDPRFLQAGDELEVQVFYNGEPMKQVEIMPDSINQLGAIVKADDNGKAKIKVANNGLNMIAVETSFPREDKTKADGDGYFSSLNFTIMPKE